MQNIISDPKNTPIAYPAMQRGIELSSAGSILSFAKNAIAAVAAPPFIRMQA
jgi:hypothetical protein